MEVRLALVFMIWRHPHLIVLDEVTTHLDFYAVQALGRALRIFNDALLIVSHDRFLVRPVIEGYTELLQLDEDDGSDEEEESKAEQQRSLHLLEKGELKLLEKGMREFEESSEARVDKLLIA